MNHEQEMRAFGLAMSIAAVVFNAAVLALAVSWNCGCTLGSAGLGLSDDDLGAYDDTNQDAPDGQPEADLAPDVGSDDPGTDLPVDEAPAGDDAVQDAVEDAQGDAGDGADQSDDRTEDIAIEDTETFSDETHETGETGETPGETTDSASSCNGPFVGEGRIAVPGTCMGEFRVGVYAGYTYTVRACDGPMVGNIVLAVYGACQCVIYQECGGLPQSGDYCTCTASEDGIMTICASAGDTSFVRWSYTVEGACWNVG